ncbi:hypothetical protein HK28_02515 [Acetobacter sp. DsW_063]|nr:hypothetical protein HK28_02515 [Acetobacter sp. DsW_063]
MIFRFSINNTGIPRRYYLHRRIFLFYISQRGHEMLNIYRGCFYYQILKFFYFIIKILFDVTKCAMNSMTDKAI